MENTKALIRALLTIINRNVGEIPENVQELYYKAHEEIKKVEEEIK